MVAFSVAGTAEAGKGNAAPIVYKGQSVGGERISSERETIFISPDQAYLDRDKARARIQFNYPGQGSASNSAVQTAQPAKREYASISAPLSSMQAPVYDPTVNQKGFDAKAAAAQIVPQQAEPSVETEALPALAAPAPREQRTVQPVQPRTQQQTPATAQAISLDPVPVFDETGLATIFGDEFEGLPTANGETFSQNDLIAAHPTLPLPSLVEVINPQTNARVIVRVNDRGPFEEGAMLQLSKRAANELGLGGAGGGNIKLRYLGAAPAIAPETHREIPAATYQTVSAEIPQAATPAPVYTYTPAAAQPTPAATTPSRYQPQAMGDYYVQVGAFSDISNAQDLERSLPAGMATVVVPARVNGADYFRVRVGPFMSRDNAERVQANLRADGFGNGRVVTAN
ncbi:MAG: septal ring lytic transglycosylase RlpA family protein [Alphaproteobacteria bacterium]|nr:septal ring lytic transglycosylase RlpA family protein [Alphaproteobacteria bacterium]